jgi:hypothetical protein
MYTAPLSTAASVLLVVALVFGAQASSLYAQGLNQDSSFGPSDDRIFRLLDGNERGPVLSLAQYVAPDNPSLSDKENSPQQTQDASTTGQGSSDRLIDSVTDPIAPLMQFRFRENWNWPVDDSGPDAQTFEFRPTIPFKAWDQENLLRITVPYDIQGSGSPGLDKVQMFDAVVFAPEWGKWGIGPDVRFDPHSSSGEGSLQAGPVLGAVAKTDRWTYGFIMQNYLGGNDSETYIQPILAYKFNDQLALAFGDMQFKYNWSGRTWTQLPLGCELDYISNLWGQKIQWFVNPQYNFEMTSSNSGWTLYVGLVLLVPGA